MTKSREKEIKKVTGQINDLLDDLSLTVAALNELLVNSGPDSFKEKLQ